MDHLGKLKRKEQKDLVSFWSKQPTSAGKTERVGSVHVQTARSVAVKLTRILLIIPHLFSVSNVMYAKASCDGSHKHKNTYKFPALSLAPSPSLPLALSFSLPGMLCNSSLWVLQRRVCACMFKHN